jgi:hypothetical protein
MTLSNDFSQFLHTTLAGRLSPLWIPAEGRTCGSPRYDVASYYPYRAVFHCCHHLHGSIHSHVRRDSLPRAPQSALSSVVLGGQMLPDARV